MPTVPPYGSSSPLPHMLYLIRHGSTANNLARPPRIQGCRSDMPLDETGVRQARRTAQLLAARPIAAIYSSPLTRARQTAEQIAAPHTLPVEPVPELREVDVGQWENLSWEEIVQRDPEAHRRFLDDPARHPYLGGENLTQVRDRVVQTIERLCARHVDQDLVIVSHNVTNRTLLAELLGVPLRLARGIHQDNCGVNVISHHGGKLKLRTLSSAFHLEGKGERGPSGP